jgi:hypothetical protein
VNDRTGCVALEVDVGVSPPDGRENQRCRRRIVRQRTEPLHRLRMHADLVAPCDPDPAGIRHLDRAMRQKDRIEHARWRLLHFQLDVRRVVTRKCDRTASTNDGWTITTTSSTISRYRCSSRSSIGRPFTGTSSFGVVAFRREPSPAAGMTSTRLAGASADGDTVWPRFPCSAGCGSRSRRTRRGRRPKASAHQRAQRLDSLEHAGPLDSLGDSGKEAHRDLEDFGLTPQQTGQQILIRPFVRQRNVDPQRVFRRMARTADNVSEM